MMDEQRLQEIEARVKAATPGPWGQWRGDDQTCATVYGVGLAGADRPVVWTEHPNFTKMMPWPDDDSPVRECEASTRDEDEEFIGHARQDVPDLVAEVRRLRGVLEVYADHDLWLPHDPEEAGEKDPRDWWQGTEPDCNGFSPARAALASGSTP